MCSSWSQLTPLPWQYWDKRKIATTLQLPRLFVSFHVLRSSCWDAWYRYLKAVEVVLGGGGGRLAQGSRTVYCSAEEPASSSSDHYWDLRVCFSSGAVVAMKEGWNTDRGSLFTFPVLTSEVFQGPTRGWGEKNQNTKNLVSVVCCWKTNQCICSVMIRRI